MKSLSALVLPQNCVIVFTRYPQPGQTKTRMIPLLGRIGAAELQRQLTEQTLRQVTPVGVPIVIYYTGGNLELMRDWLTEQYDYVNQGNGDLGERMLRAFAEIFAARISKGLLIGIDCPDLTSDILQQGFEALDHHDLVLGPALDGGYYLIGLKDLIPALFAGISWGTAQVLSQTLTIAEQLGLKTALLPPLADLDRPEDFILWRERRDEV